MQYPINEMFQTLQGEGYFTGVPAIFIRLQGCPVGCAWCDTKHTWEKLEDREVSLFSILAKTKESDKWGSASSEDLLAVIGRQGYTARHVVITDLNEYRLELARQFGVIAVNTKETDLKEVMADLGIHEGFDVGMEMSGNPIALRQLIESMYNGGRIALLGLPNKNAVELPLNTIIWNGLILKGIYGREMYETWYKMQAMVEAGFPLEKIITHRFPVQDYKQGFEAMCSGHSGKVILDWTGLQD